FPHVRELEAGPRQNGIGRCWFARLTAAAKVRAVRRPAFAKARAVRGSFSGGGSFSRGGSVMRRRNGSRFIRLAGSRCILSRLAYDWRLRSKREREAFGRVFR